MKKLTLILFVALLLTGCSKITSREVLSKKSGIEQVSHMVSDPGYDYYFNCFGGTGKKNPCRFSYGYNPNRTKIVHKDEMVYRITYLVIYENGKTKEIEEIVSKDIFEATSVGQIHQ